MAVVASYILSSFGRGSKAGMWAMFAK